MTIEKAEAVLGDDCLPAGWTNVVPGLGPLSGSCLTRNPLLAGGMVGRPGLVRLHIDTERLKHRHRVIPLDAEVVFRSTFGDRWASKPARACGHDRHHEWREEFVVGPVSPLHTVLNRLEVYVTPDVDVFGNDLIRANLLCRRYRDRWGLPVTVGLEAKESIARTLRRQKEEMEEEEAFYDDVDGPEAAPSPAF